MVAILAASLAVGFALRDGDRVVFYGDSITEQGHYSSYVEAFVATRYPKLNVRFFNRGWSGDLSWGGPGGTIEDRVQLDVVPVKPTQIFLMLGMNDGGYVPYDPKVEKTIAEWYGKLLDLLQRSSPGVKLTLARTSPWDDFAHQYASKGKPPEPWDSWHGYNEVLQKYGLIAKREASARKGTYVDFNDPVSEIVQRADKIDHTNALQIIPDGIHPSNAGGLIMAGELMKAWNVEPRICSLTLTARSSTVIAAEGTIASNVKGLSWTQLDRCLPFAYDESESAVRLVAKLANFNRLFNRQTLRVENVEAGSYDLTIDKQKIGTFSAQELGAGIELENLNTPMKQQAKMVLEMCRKRSEIDFFAWRKVRREMPASAAAKRAHDSLEQLVEEQSLEIQRMAKPKSHDFKLVRK